ncbi:MAG: hypothetical protein IKW03_10150 [Clostridia bacterium]|nr:hypothetical protein [Clostridia bacterium]
MTILYGFAFAVALIMIGIYCLVDRKREIWLLLLFVSVAVCDLGYFLLSMAQNLEFALFANRISYFGNVFLPFFLLMMIMNLSGMKYPKFLPWILIIINSAMLVITISGGFLPIYYKDVSFEIINSVPTLIKEYGPLHPIYKVYLFGYFGSMVAIIIISTMRKTVKSNKHSVFLATVLIGNIVIWLIENMIKTPFEFLSVSYIVTEGLILFLYGILQDYGLLDTVYIENTKIDIETVEEKHEEVIRFFTQPQIESIFEKWQLIETLSEREKEVLRFILANEKRQVIAQELFVTESTIKKHTANIFRKLEITNRSELFAKAKHFTE